MNLLAVFLGGGLGAVSRWLITYGVLLITHRVWAGTLLVNCIGSLILFLIHKYWVPTAPALNLFYKVGLMGGLTTFSTFSLEMVTYFKNGDYLESFLIMFLNMGICFLMGFFILRNTAT